MGEETGHHLRPVDKGLKTLLFLGQSLSHFRPTQLEIDSLSTRNGKATV